MPSQGGLPVAPHSCTDPFEGQDLFDGQEHAQPINDFTKHREDHIDYWNAVGATKTFSHPLSPTWLDGVNGDTRFLDYGCGYGRTLAELAGLGFTDLTGVDVAPAQLARARREHPGHAYALIDRPPATAYPGGSFGLIVLFAVLTCVPGDTDQAAIVAELYRLLRPGGLLYLSDLVLQDDTRNRRRYATHASASPLPYGTFTTDDGATCRHHEPAYLRSLLAGFDPVREREVEVTTMNGHRSTVLQLLVRRHGDS